MECRKGEDKRLNLWNCEDKIRDSRFWIYGLSASRSRQMLFSPTQFQFRESDRTCSDREPACHPWREIVARSRLSD